MANWMAKCVKMANCKLPIKWPNVLKWPILNRCKWPILYYILVFASVHKVCNILLLVVREVWTLTAQHKVSLVIFKASNDGRIESWFFVCRVCSNIPERVYNIHFQCKPILFRLSSEKCHIFEFFYKHNGTATHRWNCYEKVRRRKELWQAD